MDKERKAYDTLLQTINNRARCSAAAQQAHYQRQLQFLRELELQASGGPYGSKTASQLAELLAEERTQCDDSLNTWLLWLHELLLSRKQLLGETQPLLDWLLQCVEAETEQQIKVDALRCLLPLLEAMPAAEAHAQLPRLVLIQLPSSVEAALLLIRCQDALLSTLCTEAVELQAEELQLCSQLAKSVLQTHYEGCWTRLAAKTPQEQLILLLTHTLQLLQKITTQNAAYAEQQAPELLGFALCQTRCKAEGQFQLQLPQRVQPAQQSAGYGQDVQDVSNQTAATAGRRVKSRKLRSLTKQRNNAANPQEATESGLGSGSDRMQQLLLLGNSSDNHSDNNASGDASSCTPCTSDGANATKQQLSAQKQLRHGQLKLRLAALQLLSAVTKQLPRRTLYGYWHALFPVPSSSSSGDSKHHLLHIGAMDGNVRCRALALQLAAQLLYGSKAYLAQASCAAAPANYTPFALSLAHSVLAAYGQLTRILEREFAPPVLTQCLKCLAVLVQATPFEQLPMGFVYEFVPHVKKLGSHVDTSVKVSALLVMEMLIALPRLTQEIACAVGLPLSERRSGKLNNAASLRQEREQQLQFQQICDSEEEEEQEQGVPEQGMEKKGQQEQGIQKQGVQEQGLQEQGVQEQRMQKQELEKQERKPEQQRAAKAKTTCTLLPACWPRIPRNSWVLRLILRYLDCPASSAPLRIECLQVLLAMATHFALLREHLARLALVLRNALTDSSMDVRLYGARCLDAVGFQMTRQVMEQQTQTEHKSNSNVEKQAERQPELDLELHLAFWLRLLPSIYECYAAASTVTLRSSLCDALSNMGSYSFERLPQAQRNGLLAFLLGCSSDDAAERLVRAAALRALAVYVLHPTLRSDLVFVEHAAELTLRLSEDSQLTVRIKAAWALGNISDALLATTELPEQQEHLQQERISQTLLSRLIEAAVRACSDHDKVRANGVRALGNLLRLLPAVEHALMQRAIAKLLDCVRAAGSAKVKWNACYAIGSLVRSRALFASSASSAATLFAALSQLIVQHANFKVRINATAVLLQIEQRADFGTHYASVWRSLLDAIERSHALDTFEEYNHRDALQQQLCLTMAHMLARARPDDLLACRSSLEAAHLDVVSATWRRVAYRIVPEQAAPLFTCSSLLQQRYAATSLSADQQSALTFLADALRLEG